MSVLLWASGETWWTNSGYWPYGTKGRSEAVSWAGSNAPHLLEETAHSERKTTLNSYGWSEGLAVMDLQRAGPIDYVARRQVVHIMPSLWIVVDNTWGSENTRTTTTWTTSPDVSLSEGKILGSYILKSEKTGASLTKIILGSDGMKISRFSGSSSLFAGWVQERPASSIVVEQPADNSWTVTIWSLDDGYGSTLRVTGQPYMQEWKGSEDWDIMLPLALGPMRIWRKSNHIGVNGPSGSSISEEITLLMRQPDLEHRFSTLRSRYEAAENKYPKAKHNLARRQKATHCLIIIFLLQEPFFFLYKRRIRRYYGHLRILTIAAWVGMLIYLHVLYF
jgi:hypothetical protein